MGKITGDYSLQNEIIDILLKKGYPEQCFFPEWEINGLKYNLAIIDPEKQDLLAVFEYNISGPVVFSSEGIRRVVEKYSRLTVNPNVQLYIISATKGQSSFSIKKILYQTRVSARPHFSKAQLLSFSDLKSFVLNNTIDVLSVDNKISKLEKKIDEIDDLKSRSPWGPEYKIWLDLTEKLVRGIFGEDGLNFFKQQHTVLLSNEAYMQELDKRKILLKKLLANRGEYTLGVENKNQDKTTKSNGSPVYNIEHAEQVHFGSGDNLKNATKESTKKGFWSNFFWFGVVPLVVALLAGLILKHLGA